MDFVALKSELTTDPLVRNYAGMNDAQAATSLNTVDRTKFRRSIQTWEILEATVPSEWAALSAAEKQRYQTIVSCGTVDPFGANVVASFQTMFAGGTTTRSNLTALRTLPAARWDELGLERAIEAVDVAKARALP